MATQSCTSWSACLMSFMGLVMNLVAIGTTNWLVSRTHLKMNLGIFRHCDCETQYCGGMSEISAIVDAQEVAWFRAVQALFLLSCIGSLLACILIGLVLIYFFESRGTFKVIAFVQFGTVVSEIMSLVFFGLKYRDIFVITSSEDFLSYSYFSACTAVFFIFIALIMSAIEASQTSKVLLNMQHRITVWSSPYTLFLDQEQQ